MMLVLLGAGWIAARAVLWEGPPMPDPASASTVAAQAVPLIASGPRRLPGARTGAVTEASASRRPKAVREAPMARVGRSRGGADPPAHRARPGAAAGGASPELFAIQAARDEAGATSLGDQGQTRPPRPGIAIVAKRWSVDGWFAWRSGSGLPRRVAGVPFSAAYGGTQGGVLARYDLSGGGRRPQAFVRLTHAPNRPAQSDLALGVGLRPLSAVPVRAQAEVRATRSGGRTSIAPAATLVTELPAIELPLGFRAESYGQAGWVGGDFATGFVDGQVRADRQVASLGRAVLRLGGGAWGGAQKFANRLDVGPGATLDLRGAGVPARVSLDYRFQVAGNARPDDGIAVTLSTGF